MNIEEYISELETLLEDNGVAITQKTVDRLAKRAVQLEDEILSEEDIYDELLEVLPKKYADLDEVTELIAQFADIVLAECENSDNVEDDD